ncbi:AI-2E family transporter [Pedobacter alpinus]|uniref:AI-2E family transporter n=1 Tax=Pedobacter alpinus TaxID=1590643 RepID=A0ABW5TUC0_9SPHI
MKENEPNNELRIYTNKVWATVGIVALSLILLLVLEATFNVFLLIFAGILIAVFFTGLSSLIHRKSKWNKKVCVSISILGSLLLIVGFFWLVGAQINTQLEELTETIPKTISNAQRQLEGSSVGDKLIKEVTSDESAQKMKDFAGKFFSSTFGVFGDIYVILFIGIFITVAPDTYISGFVSLIPEKGKNKAKTIFQALGQQLRNWIKGTMLSMFVVFVLTAIGLAIMGMPLWLVLALLAGLLSFIPNFGPILALIPAVLVALMQSPQTALWVVGLYMLIQFIESNFITTLIQKKMVNISPALIIASQLILGSLTGSWGLILSMPLTVVLIVLIQRLYIDKKEENKL